MAFTINYKSIRVKLWLAFLAFFLLMLGLFITYNWYQEKNRDFERYKIGFLLFERSVNQSWHASDAFLIQDIADADYYENGQSEHLVNRVKHHLRALKIAVELSKNTISRQSGTITIYDSLMVELTMFNSMHEQLIDILNARGFEDFGLEGEMRKKAHLLEDRLQSMDLATLLLMRRYEKDYILRGETKYIEELHKIVLQMDALIVHTTPEKSLERVYLRKKLKEYINLFDQLVHLNNVIGLHGNDTGLLGKLLKQRKTIEERLDAIRIRDKVYMASVSEQITWIFFSTAASIIIMWLVISITVSRSLGRNIQLLTYSIRKAISYKFDRSIHIEEINSRDEIGELSRDFSYMLHKVQDGIDEVHMRQQEVINGLEYAQTVQKSILPGDKLLKQCFHEYFYIFHPHNYVSGDFYWAMQTKEYNYIALVDCAGHGVPGGLMSILGSSLLNEIVRNNPLIDPQEAIIQINYMFSTIVKNEENNVKLEGGMEIAFCRLKKQEEGITQFLCCGAKRPIIVYKDHEENILKESRAEVGNIKFDASKLILHELELKEGDRIYLFSDGYKDQSNRVEGRMGKKNFYKLIKDIQEHSIVEQQRLLDDYIVDYVGKEGFRDDVTIFGVEI